jgi:hypothetical protein
LLPLAVIGIALGIGFFFLAPRLGKNRFLWLILSIVPVVNFVFWYYAAFVTLFAILDKLNALAAAAGSQRREA